MIVTDVLLDTVLVVMLKVALIAPAGTVTLAGTCATAVLLLESATTAPLEGAVPFKVTVPVELLPPTTDGGLTDMEESTTEGMVPP